MEKPPYFLLNTVEVFYFSSAGRKHYGVLHPDALDKVMAKWQEYERMMRARETES
jgi:hypothetical protein